MTIAVLLLIVLGTTMPTSANQVGPSSAVARANPDALELAASKTDLVALRRAIRRVDARQDTTVEVEEVREMTADEAAAIHDIPAALEQKLGRLDELDRIRQEEAIAATAPPLPASTAPTSPGGWICPVQGPVEFVDSWGNARSGGRSHQGVDMMASRGTPTVAPVSGRVLHKESGLGGLTWYVYGDDGTTYYGAHLSGYANQGVSHVPAGTVIGYVGDSGNATGTNHLHFEIHPNGGSAVDPYPVVAQHC